MLGVGIAVVGCALDLSDKLACSTDGDCLSGFRCVSARCERATAAVDAGSSGSSNLDTPGPLFAASGRFQRGAAGGQWGAGGAANVSEAGEAGALADDPAPAPVLSSLQPSIGSLSPRFDPDVHAYVLEAPLLTSAFRFTATMPAGATLTLNGSELASGVASAWLDLDAVGGVFEFRVSEAGQASEPYRVSVHRGLSMPKVGLVKSSDAREYSPFGYSVALSGDTLAVGSADSVDVYRQIDGMWSPEGHLLPRGGDSGDGFGESVALDGNTLVVGALFEDSAARTIDGDRQDDSAPSAGAAYVFERSGHTWVEKTYLKASNADAGDSFGESVAILGDLIAVGAPYEASAARGVNGDATDNSAGGAGAVYLFTRSGQSWVEQAYLKASNARFTPVGAFFGQGLALAPHGLAVGAQNDSSGVVGDPLDASMPGSGAVYLFAESGGVWAEEAYLKASHPDVNDLFGRSLAYDGSTLVVGAPYEDSAALGVNHDQSDNSALDSGAAYVFRKAAGEWQAAAYLKASDSQAGDVFGWSVGLSEQTVVVGAWAESRHDGAAYVFAPDSGAWSERAKLTAHTVRGADFQSESRDGFGAAVSLTIGGLVVGAPYEGQPVAASPHGTAYLFE